jgi:hypothetical protein
MWVGYYLHRWTHVPAAAVRLMLRAGGGRTLYCYLFGETKAAVRPAAMHRVQAMVLSDQRRCSR